ncbi:MAG: DUF1800 family protein [Saprospiraceae bacterium]
MKIINFILSTTALLVTLGLNGQSYTDYVGAGHNVGMTVTASHSLQNSLAENTFNAEGMDSKYFEASRFLNQATIGHTTDMVNDLLANDLDFESWIDYQFTKNTTHLTQEMEDIWDIIYAFRVGQGEDPDDIFGPWGVHFNYAWWQMNMTNEEDVLRHKVAYALSQIVVISENSDLGSWADALTGYYDILLDNSFGNYKDLLKDVSLSIQMGYYLSHYNNAKANLEENTSPDENYAREIMQLFSIGLYMLNPDGSRVLDGNGQPIPTYDNNDIQEFAKIFTGLGPAELIDPNEWPYNPFFGLGIWAVERDVPMVMYQEFHETEEKQLLNGLVVPANQSGMMDIDMAIDNLFNHPNVGPFIGKLLIQRLIKSNPSPEYIGRVSAAFNDNGSGVRGDMKAVVKTILIDSEARTGERMLTLDAGKAREPFLKYTALARIVEKDSPLNRYWNNGYGYLGATGQHVLAAPTVFNFYLPDFQPVGDIAAEGLVAPELKLHNTSNSVRYINRIFSWMFWEGGNIMYDWEDDDFNNPPVSIVFDEFVALADQPELLINKLDKYFTYGQLTDETRQIMRDALYPLIWNWDDEWKEERVSAALYYMLISPDFNILK